MNDIGGMRSRPFRAMPQNPGRPAQAGAGSGSPVQAAPAVFSPGTGNTAKPPASTAAPGKNKKTKLMVIVGIVLIVALAAAAVFFFLQYKNSQKKDEGEAVSKRIISQVSEHYLLPGGEDPTVAEIRDKSKLKDQSFFDSAKDGDFLLVYQKAQLALLYRESDDKLVNVGPVSTGQDQNQQQQGQVSGAQTE